MGRALRMKAATAKEKVKKRGKKKSRSKSPAAMKKRVEKTNKIAKQHKKKLLDAKKERQRERNIQMMRQRRREQNRQKEQKAKLWQSSKEEDPKTLNVYDEPQDYDEYDKIIKAQYKKEDSSFRRLLMYIEAWLAKLFYFIMVTLRSERTFDMFIFLANNLGLYQEYEINDYGQRLSPRTGRPVLLSLGPLRVVHVVESANQVRSFWDPYIREYLKNSNLTTDCWRANRMALQVALCMDDTGAMYDMPLPQEPDSDSPAKS